MMRRAGAWAGLAFFLAANAALAQQPVAPSSGAELPPALQTGPLNLKFGGPGGADVLNAIVALPDGGMIVSGTNESAGVMGGAWVMRLDRNGTAVWDKGYLRDSGSEAYQVELASDGGLFVAGVSGVKGPGKADGWVARLDPQGEVLWSRNPGVNLDDEIRSVRALSDGGVVVAGWTRSRGAGGKDAWVQRLDVKGAVVWDKTFGGPNDDAAASLAVAADGKIALAGFTESSGAGHRDAWVIQLDGEGQPGWEKTFGTNGDDEANAIIAFKEGGFSVAGRTKSQGDSTADAWIFRLDAQGGMLWEKIPAVDAADETKGDNSAEALTVLSDGGLAVAGWAVPKGLEKRNVWVIRLDGQGRTQWDKLTESQESAWAKSVAVLADGSIAVVGVVQSAGTKDTDALLFSIPRPGAQP